MKQSENIYPFPRDIKISKALLLIRRAFFCALPEAAHDK